MATEIHRRTLISGAMATGLLSPLFAAPAASAGASAGTAPLGSQLRRAVPADPQTIDPQDSAYWAQVAAQFDVTKAIVQLENGNWGSMARPVEQAYARKLAKVNAENSYYARRGFWQDILPVRARAAAILGVEPEEIAYTRGATEALQTLIAGYNHLRPGDQVLYSDLDYDSTQAAFRWLKQRRGADLVTFALPEPATHQGLIDAYARALEANPKVRLMLLTHVGHRSGLVTPVKEIVALARARGVDVILDSAHAWGQLDFTLPELGADFVGLTCQKWIGAPMGVGLVYIRKDRLDAIDPNMSEVGNPDHGTQSRVHTGTASFAGYLALADALDFHEAIGIRAKEARLRFLRDRWAEALRGHPGLEILTPADPRLTSALTSFRLRGQTSVAQNKALAATLLDRFGIFTVHREGLASGACVRVTPAIFTAEADIDRLVAALKTLAG